MPYIIDPKTGKKIEIDPITGQPAGQQTSVQPPATGMSTTSPNIFAEKKPVIQTPEQKTQENIEEYKGERNILQKGADFFLPRASKLARKLGGTINLKKDLKQADKIYEEFKDESDKYAEMAKKEKDPEKKKKYFDLAKQALDAGSRGYEEAPEQFEKSTGIGFEEETNIFRESVGVAGEIGSYLLPTEKLSKGASLVQKILAGAKMGAKTGVLLGATSPEDLTIEERVTETLKQGGSGAFFGGVISSAWEVPKAVVKKTLGDSTKRLAMVFKLPNSVRRDLRKFGGVKNFEEEILTKEGKAIAGMEYSDLLKHFDSRKTESQKALDAVLDNIAVKPKKLGALNMEVVSIIDDAISNAGDEVLQGGAKPTLQQLRDDVIKNPINSYKRLNEIKRIVQKTGRAAYSPSGTPSATSNSLADVGSEIKEMIEGAGKSGDKNLVREANKSIQLYEAARSAVESAGDTEIKKISNDLTQKFMQVLPTMFSGGVAAASFAAGGTQGGMAGFMLSQMMLGTLGAARVKYFTPQIQTRLAQSFSSILSNQGAKNADKAAQRIVQEMARVAAIRNSDKGIEQPDQAVSEQPQQEPGTGNQYNQTQQDQVGADIHAPIISETKDQGLITIKNEKTGETKQVGQNELNQYGISGGPGSQNGMPTKEDILSAMAMDLEQTGGKSLSKLNTFLNAIQKVEESNAPEGPAGKEIPAGVAEGIADYDSAVSLMDEVGTLLKDSKDLFGPVKGVTGTMNPWNVPAQTADATLRRAAQIVGKAMEGGVLRKEDEVKYRKMLPQLDDTHAVAEDKMNKVRAMLKQNRQQKLNALIKAGYNPEKVSFGEGASQPIGTNFTSGESAF